MWLEHTGSRLFIHGDISSSAHEAILKQTALNGFADREQLFELQVRAALPPGWALLTEMTLRALAETHSATAQIDQSGVSIRGVTSNHDRWDEAAARLGKALLPGMVLRQDMADVGPVISLGKQCRQLFRAALRGRSVEFPRASSTLGTRAYPLLDELIQIAADCPAAHIKITGHPDPQGSKESNAALSLARARAVASYMVAGGIDPERLLTAAAARESSAAADKDARSGQRGRQVEFEFTIP